MNSKILAILLNFTIISSASAYTFCSNPERVNGKHSGPGANFFFSAMNRCSSVIPGEKFRSNTFFYRLNHVNFEKSSCNYELQYYKEKSTEKSEQAIGTLNCSTDLSIEETKAKINNSGLLPVSHRLREIYSSLGSSKNNAVVVPDATPAKTER